MHDDWGIWLYEYACCWVHIGNLQTFLNEGEVQFQSISDSLIKNIQ
jgi:hypothetical protein